MKEKEVVNLVKKWINSGHPERFMPSSDYGADILVLSSEIFQQRYVSQDMLNKAYFTYHMQIECKGTYSNHHRAIGQCLEYFIKLKGIPTYLAFPRDYSRLEIVEKIIAHFNLPIGIMLVSENGAIDIKRIAQGKERSKKIKEKS